MMFIEALKVYVVNDMIRPGRQRILNQRQVVCIETTPFYWEEICRLEHDTLK